MMLSQREAHHARDVLRLEPGAVLELFDDAGATARAIIVSCDGAGVVIHVDELATHPPAGDLAVRLTVASAVPKGDRADWMIEKLSELGVDRFIPLAAARSVVLPEGKNKRQRWKRIATEAAKQSRRRGVMRIDELTKLDEALRDAIATGSCCYLSTSDGAKQVLEFFARTSMTTLMTFVGPEGGWTDEEIERFDTRGAVALKLTSTVLRVETAAVAIASIVGSADARGRSS